MIATQQNNPEAMKVLLIGNYPVDGQESMRRFADLLAHQLPDRGIQVEQLCPTPVFGRFGGGLQQSGKWLGYMDKFLLFPRKLRKRLRELRAESLVHICDHSNAVYAPILKEVPHLVTCHDLLAVRSALGEFPGRRIGATGRQYQKWILHGLNAAGRVACISNATRRDLLRLSTLASHQTNVIHNGLNFAYRPLPKAVIGPRLNHLALRCFKEPASKRKLRAGYLLHVGGNQWYKNRLGAIQIHHRLCERMSRPPQLVMVGKPFAPEMRQWIATHQLEDRVIELDGVSNDDLQTLYCGAQLLLFPSFEEGFGWPIIEAQACGCPAVIADREPMSEIGGAAALYFKIEPAQHGEVSSLSLKSIEAAADALLRGLSERGGEREDRVNRGLRNVTHFSTAGMVEGYIQMYQRMLRVPVEPKLPTLEPVSAR